MLIKYHHKCRLCGKYDTFRTIYDFGEHYLHGSFVFKDFQPPTRKVPVNLVRCAIELNGCGLVQLRHSIDPSILYAKYGYRSSTNPKMTKHLKGIVDDIMSIKSDIKTVLSIGGNDCYSLSCFPKYVKKFVVDPCDIVNKVDIDNLTVFNETYPCNTLSNSKNTFFDFIEFVACFYDLDEPVEAAKAIAFNLSFNGLALIEVSYWPDKMANNAMDECVHEHVTFFSYDTLEQVFTQAGLKIIRVKKNDINGGSIQILLVHKDNNIYDRLEWKNEIEKIKLDEFNRALDSKFTYTQFCYNIENLKTKVHRFVSNLARLGNKIHLLAGSTKGNLALQFFNIDNTIIPYCSERNPDKFGGFTLGTNIKMISEAESRLMKPSYYLVTNWSFKKEVIERELDYLKEGGKLIFCIPNLIVVEYKDGNVVENVI